MQKLGEMPLEHTCPHGRITVLPPHCSGGGPSSGNVQNRVAVVSNFWLFPFHVHLCCCLSEGSGLGLPQVLHHLVK